MLNGLSHPGAPLIVLLSRDCQALAFHLLWVLSSCHLRTYQSRLPWITNRPSWTSQWQAKWCCFSQNLGTSNPVWCDNDLRKCKHYKIMLLWGFGGDREPCRPACLFSLEEPSSEACAPRPYVCCMFSSCDYRRSAFFSVHELAVHAYQYNFFQNGLISKKMKWRVCYDLSIKVLQQR